MKDTSWRLINDSAHTGSYNMATDEAILEACIAGDSPPTLRIYSWNPPAITLGRFQRLERAVKLDACTAANVEIARRPTGGRAILHAREITFSIVAPLTTLGTQGVMDTYRLFGDGILTALQSLGINAQLIDRVVPTGSTTRNFKSSNSTAACFAVKSRCDLMVAGLKIVGSAQVHIDGVVLQQNSLPFVIDAESWDTYFQGMHGLDAQAVGLWQAAGRQVPFAEIAAALKEGFTHILGIDFVEGNLTESEFSRIRELQPKCLLLSANESADDRK